MKKHNTSKHKYIPISIALIVFSLLSIITLKFAQFKKGQWEKDIRTRALEVLITKKTKLEKALYSRVYYTKSVAAYVSLHPEITTFEFYNLANELIKNDSVISTMALSKDCIIGAIYPKKGHESAIGLDLLDHPERKEIVEKTIETQKPFIAGPVKLVEGGIAFISYTPVFNKTSGKENDFWGVTDIVIYKDRLLEQAELFENDQNFSYALKGYNGQGLKGKTWWGNNEVFSQQPVTVNIDLPYGNWILATVPVNGWKSYYNQDLFVVISLIVSSFMISILLWMLAKSYLKLRHQQNELTAIFNSLDSLIIEFDKNGKYIKIPPVNNSLLFDKSDKLISKTLYDIFDKEMATMFHKAITECLETGQLVEIDYPLEIEGKCKWFHARITFKDDNAVIYHAFDITGVKENQKKIEESEQQLRELNNTKDKFFSIIAHDLKNPLGSLNGLAEMLYQRFDSIDDEKKHEWIKAIYQNSGNVYKMMKNLLTWSRTQRGMITYTPVKIKISELIDQLFEIHYAMANAKAIQLINNIDPKTEIESDNEILNTILSNIISNSIKYTNKNGTVTAMLNHEGSNTTISIVDNGIGMSRETQNNLFNVGKNISKPGTAQELGTGLGLIVVKEFSQIINAEITVESEPGIGTSFHLKL